MELRLVKLTENRIFCYWKSSNRVKVGNPDLDIIIGTNTRVVSTYLKAILAQQPGKSVHVCFVSLHSQKQPYKHQKMLYARYK